MDLEQQIITDALKTVPLGYKNLLDMYFEDFKGEPVTVLGWARSVRKLKKGDLLFLQLYDNTCKKDLQVIVEKDNVPSAEFEAASRGKTRWCFEVTGHVKISPGNEQPWELVANSVKVVGECDEDYPLQKRGKKEKQMSIDKLRSLPHLRVQNYVFSAIARLRHTLAMSVHDFFRALGCYWVSTPIVTFSDCEGAGEAFVVTTEQEMSERCAIAKQEGGLKESLKIASQPTVTAGNELITKWQKALSELSSASLKDTFFSRTAYLTVSGQLEGEAYAMALTKIYTFGPTFRAEESHTSRHLPEFWMIEPEIVDIDLNGLMTLGEKFVQFCIVRALSECKEELQLLEKTFGLQRIENLQKIASKPFVRLSYTEAIEILQQEQTKGGVIFEESPEWGIDLGSEHERHLTDTVYGCPVILHSYPKKIKAFYMKRSPSNNDAVGSAGSSELSGAIDNNCSDTKECETVQACDWLVPGVGELIGGSIREENYETLKTEMESRGMDTKSYSNYLDLRRYGTAPHGGFGLGFERLISFVGGVANVRDVIPFPRWPGY